jgi:hypothetical protein
MPDTRQRRQERPGNNNRPENNSRPDKDNGPDKNSKDEMSQGMSVGAKEPAARLRGAQAGGAALDRPDPEGG